MDEEELSGEVPGSFAPTAGADEFDDFNEEELNFDDEDQPEANGKRMANGDDEELSNYGDPEPPLRMITKPKPKPSADAKPPKPKARKKKIQQEPDPYAEEDEDELSNQEESVRKPSKPNKNFSDNQSNYSYGRSQGGRSQMQQSVGGNEEELSDYEDEDEISQYQKSIFGEMKDVKSRNSSLLGEKRNSSFDMDNMSEDVKKSEKTVDGLAVKRFDKGKFKAEKREKFNESSDTLHSEMGQNNNQAISKKEKIENKKRFSKKQLELVSRKFSDYYAYETNRDYTGVKITLRDIGQMFDLGHATIHKLYAEWMDDPYFYERIKRYDRYRKQTKNPERKLTLDRLEHITRLIKENPFLTQYELCVELNKIEDLKVIKCGQRQNMTRTIVGKLLRMGKFRKKRVKCIPKEKNTSKSLEKRYDYCVKYKEILERHAKVYFLDESGFNLYMTRDKAWSRPNEEITVNCPISKGKRFSLIAIIGDDGLAHWRFIEGNYRKFEYLDFIRELFQKLQDQKSPEDPEERWLVLDNCAIHDKEQTINLAREHGLNVLYLPSYSPQLNPIENWFHEIKCKLKKINYSGEKQLFNIMERILKEYEVHDFSNYYHGSLKFVEKGLKKEKF